MALYMYSLDSHISLHFFCVLYINSISAVVVCIYFYFRWPSWRSSLFLGHITVAFKYSLCISTVELTNCLPSSAIVWHYLHLICRYHQASALTRLSPFDIRGIHNSTPVWHIHSQVLSAAQHQASMFHGVIRVRGQIKVFWTNRWTVSKADNMSESPRVL